MLSTASALTKHSYEAGAALYSSEHTGNTAPSPARLLHIMTKSPSLLFPQGQVFIDINKTEQNAFSSFYVKKKRKTFLDRIF